MERYEKLNTNSRVREKNKAQRTTWKSRGLSTSQGSDHSVRRGHRRGWQLLGRQKWQWVSKDGQEKRTRRGRCKQKRKAKVGGRGHPPSLGLCVPAFSSPSHRRQSKGRVSLPLMLWSQESFLWFSCFPTRSRDKLCTCHSWVEEMEWNIRLEKHEHPGEVKHTLALAEDVITSQKRSPGPAGRKGRAGRAC